MMEVGQRLKPPLVSDDRRLWTLSPGMKIETMLPHVAFCDKIWDVYGCCSPAQSSRACLHGPNTVPEEMLMPE